MVVLGRQEEENPPALFLGYNNKSMLFSVLSFGFVGALLGAIVFTGDIRIVLAVIAVRIPLAAFRTFGVSTTVEIRIDHAAPYGIVLMDVFVMILGPFAVVPELIFAVDVLFAVAKETIILLSLRSSTRLRTGKRPRNQTSTSDSLLLCVYH